LYRLNLGVRFSKETFAIEGTVYRRWAILSPKIEEGELDLVELSKIEDTLIELGYQKVGL
ncbi:MAG: hypothetical protein AABX99_03765, partial [Nanoarchaeota archaeon]